MVEPTVPCADTTIVPSSVTTTGSTSQTSSASGSLVPRCFRQFPISGRYEGEMTQPSPGSYVLDLRVDIDVRYANSPVMDRLSGDMYQLFGFHWPFFGGRRYGWRIYRQSWIVDQPSVTWSDCQVEITGRVRFWKGSHVDTDIRVVIPWGNFRAIGPAVVTFSEPSGAMMVYRCAKKSDAFRDVTLEVDVCQSVSAEPCLPSYDTHAHANRPVDLPQRTLTIEETYREAGIAMTIRPERSIIDDSNPDFETWSEAELHDAMEQYFGQVRGGWPKWQLWCILAGTFDDPAVGGIMFDYQGAEQRKGCAIFRKHQWFDDLVANPPTNAQQAAAMRKLLYTYVHEIGHAFNYLHSWDKGRPDALSWMNYDWRFDRRNGPDSFWASFRMRFDDEELVHLRHGDRSAVIMGGDPWSSGSHLEAPAGAMSELLGEAPLGLLLRSKGYFQFMEPVILELRIRNLADLPLEVDAHLHPEFGGVTLYIRRPDGSIVEYSPVLCKLSLPNLCTLQPLALDKSNEGEDRYSQNVMLSFGAEGFYFDQPGEYQVRAIYQGPGDLLIPSDAHQLRIGHPFSPDEEHIAQDYFTHETGMALYLGGSSSPFLEKGMDTLQEIAERYPKSSKGAQVSLVLAGHMAQPFFRIRDEALVNVHEADPMGALALTDKAMDQQKRDASTFTNITYHELRRTRAHLMATVGQVDEAKKELQQLTRQLRARGVNEPVLREIQSLAKSL
jgi:hypothetical protein